MMPEFMGVGGFGHGGPKGAPPQPGGPMTGMPEHRPCGCSDAEDSALVEAFAAAYEAMGDAGDEFGIMLADAINTAVAAGALCGAMAKRQRLAIIERGKIAMLENGPSVDVLGIG